MGIFIEYTSMNDSIVAVDACVGRLSGVAPGNAVRGKYYPFSFFYLFPSCVRVHDFATYYLVQTVLATFYGNARTILCQAHGKVRVGVPSAAILNVQSEQLAVGREMPIFPFLIEARGVTYLFISFSPALSKFY